MAYIVVTLTFSRRPLTVEIAFLPLLLKRPLPFVLYQTVLKQIVVYILY